MQFVCDTDTLYVNKKRGINSIRCKAGNIYDFPFDVRDDNRHFSPLSAEPPEMTVVEPTFAPPEVPKDYSNSKYEKQGRGELIAEAKERGITGADRMNKIQLVKELEQNDAKG